MKPPCDVVIFVEHIARELDIAAAVALHLDRTHRLRAEVASTKFDLLENVSRIGSAKVAAFPWFYEDDDGPIRRVREHWPNVRLVNLAYEQVLQNINQAVKTPHGDLARTEVRHFAWGEFYKDLLVRYGVAPELVTVVGNPSYGLYRPPYSEFFPGRAALAAKHGLDPNKRWLLVAENYGAAFYADDHLEVMVARGASREESYAFRDFASASLAKMAEWLRDACREDLEIILRPRPYTPLERLRKRVVEAIGELPPGLKMIQDGSVREWVLASDAVCSSYSTTLIESAVAGKPIAMLTPLPLPEFVKHAWYDLVPQFSTSEAFGAWVGDPGFGSAQGLEQWANETMLAHGDPIAGMADFLAHAAQGSAPAGIPLSMRPSLHARLLARVLKRARGRRPDKAHEHDRFSQHDVQSRVERWRTILK